MGIRRDFRSALRYRAREDHERKIRIDSHPTGPARFVKHNERLKKMPSNIFKFVFQSRGAANLLKRSFQIMSRFGVRADRMGKRFDQFMDLLDSYNCRPTFPITALPMSRNPELARRLLARGAELAVHAYTHVDLSALDKNGQMENLGKAVQLFRDAGIPFTGFRAPYLHWNEDTMSVVDMYQFRYSSNQTVMWSVVDLEELAGEQTAGWEKAKAFYRPLDADCTFVLPSRKNGFIEIPVSLPDDEILIDRMYFKSPDVLNEVWSAILDQTHRRGELFTIQLHPERFSFFSQPLEDLLSMCREKKRGVWVASLEEIAEWWKMKSQNNAEFIREDGVYKVIVKACRGATVYLRGRSGERSVEPGVIKIESGRRPCIGLSPGSHSDAAEILRDKGYVLEVGEQEDAYEIHLGRIDSADYRTMREHLDRLEKFNGPLLRFGVWPHGNWSAVAVTGDIDALTIWDFVNRFRGA
jgi:peptidoglycan/xylan/chitin deacetylase (PgdA/CDA1 family)